METISIDLDQTWIRPSNSTKKKKKGKKLSVKIIRFDQVDEKCSIVVLSLYRARMNKKKKKENNAASSTRWREKISNPLDFVHEKHDDCTATASITNCNCLESFFRRRTRENEILHAPSRMLSYIYVYVCMRVCVLEDDTSKNIASGESRTHGARMRVRVPQFLSVRTESKSFERSLSGKKKKNWLYPLTTSKLDILRQRLAKKKNP